MRDGAVEIFIDKMTITKLENTCATNDHDRTIEDVIDKIQTEDLVDNILILKGEKTPKKLFDDTLSLSDIILYSGDLMVSNGNVLLHTGGLLPVRIQRPHLRIRILSVPYLFGGLSLITIGTMVIFFHKMNRYLFYEYHKIIT